MATASPAPALDNRNSRIVVLGIHTIIADLAMQPRVAMNKEHQKMLETSFLEGEKPHPLDVYFDGKTYWLVDGFHRLAALIALDKTMRGFGSVRCRVFEGTKEDAIIAAAQANSLTLLPMTAEDRKKAMWMILDTRKEEYTQMSSAALGKLVHMNSWGAKRAHVEWGEMNSVEISEYCMRPDGTLAPRKKRRLGKNGSLPRITKKKNTRDRNSRSETYYKASVDGDYISLGIDPEDAERKLKDYLEKIEITKKLYEKISRIQSHFVSRGIHSESIWTSGLSNKFPGCYGLNVRGIVVTYESFRDKAGAISAIGRAIACREETGFTRVVVLCPVEDGPAEVMDLGRKAGIEWMTVDDFIASLGKTNEPTAEPDHEA